MFICYILVALCTYKSLDLSISTSLFVVSINNLSQRQNNTSSLLHVEQMDEDPVAELPDCDDQDYQGSKLLSRCLGAWREAQDDVGSLATMLPSCEIVVHDGEFYVSAKVDQRYIPELMRRRWGRHSIIQVKSTSGLAHRYATFLLKYSIGWRPKKDSIEKRSD